MHISEKKLGANRRNAQDSTGPKSTEGKLRSCQNSRKHGATAALLICANQAEEEAFQQLLAAVRSSSNPVGMIEEILVEEIATCVWKLGRCALWEQKVLGTQQSPVVKAMLKKFEDKCLLSLPISSTDREESAAQQTPEGTFPWAFGESQMLLRNYERDEKRHDSFLEDGQEEDVEANHLQVRVHLKDPVETLHRYEKRIKKDLYLAIDKLLQLQKLRKGK